MDNIKDLQNIEAKLIKRIIVVSIIISLLIAFFAAINAANSSSALSNCANGLEFSLAVNGTMQTVQSVSINLGPITSSYSYCEIYTLTNEATTPIVITATTTVSPSSTAILTWQGGLTVTLPAGATQKMTLTLTDFSAAGTAYVTFSSSSLPCPTPTPTPKPTPCPTPTPTHAPK